MSVSRLIIALVASSVPAVPASAREPDAKLPAAVKLWDAYRTNEASADMKYTGKTVQFLVPGPVGKTRDGRYFIAGHVLSPPREGMAPGVVCLVRPEDVKILAEAPDGPMTAFLVVGTCRGARRNSAAYQFMQVTVDDCRILDVLTWKDKRYQSVR